MQGWGWCYEYVQAKEGQATGGRAKEKLMNGSSTFTYKFRLRVKNSVSVMPFLLLILLCIYGEVI